MKPDLFEQAAEILKSGGVVAYPTETFFGLGADALSRKAVNRVYRLKGREAGKPIPILVSDRKMLARVARGIDARAEVLMRAFWPGPLTLVFRARKAVPENLTGGTGRVGVRISSGAAARRLVKAAGRPLTATSANPAGAEPTKDALRVKNYFPAGVDLVIPGKGLRGRKGSTVLDLTVRPAAIIREGEIGRKRLEKYVRLRD